jgi:predicted nucleic acid-binding protein
MSAAQGYLLDTNIVLHATRENSPVSREVDRQFQLRSSPFRPAICEVTVGELWAFAQAWGARRRELLRRTIADLLVLHISDERIRQRWAELYSFARDNGLAIQQDHNDIWIAATAHVAGLRLLSTDASAFLPLRGTAWVDVEVLDARTGVVVS